MKNSTSLFSAPGTITEDFDRYLSYVEENPVRIGKKTGHVTHTFLQELNERMSSPVSDNSPRSPQTSYPLLHLFQHLSLRSGLVKKTPAASSNVIIMEITDKVHQYRELTEIQKYFSLLKIFWVECDFREFNKRNRYPQHKVKRFLSTFQNLTPNQTYREGKIFSAWPFNFQGTLGHIFSHFGWYDVQRDEEAYQKLKKKIALPIKELTPGRAGIEIVKILVGDRPFARWNKHSEPELTTAFADLIRSMKNELKEESSPDEEEEAENDRDPDERFLDAFEKILPPEALENRLRVDAEEDGPEGNYLFHVRLKNHRCWRKIKISSESTFGEFHREINGAFGFGFDHLYEFSLDNQLTRARNSIKDRRSESPPFAHEVTLGESGLRPGQMITYLYDFGDCWRFEIELREVITDEPLVTAPMTVKEHGEPPNSR